MGSSKFNTFDEPRGLELIRLRPKLRKRLTWSLCSLSNDVDSTCHLADVGAGDTSERFEVDHFHGPRLRSDAFDRDERIPVVSRDGDAVDDASLGWNARQLFA